MRLILTWLATFQLRWALADLHRSALLGQQADEAFALAERRMAYATHLGDRARRAGLSTPTS